MSVEIIAEISGNHGGDMKNAIRLIGEAKSAGADTVKFQCFEPDRLAAKRASDPYVVWLAGGRPLVDLYRETHTPKSWFPWLIDAAADAGINWFSSVFDPDDVAFLETLSCPRYKISAFEMLDGDLINAVVATGKPIVMSVRPRPGVTVLLATDYHNVLPPVGLSDHCDDTRGNDLPKWWAQHNAPMIERHIRLPDVETPDSPFSSTPEEFRQYVQVIRS